VIIFSLTMSTAIFTAAAAVRFPFRVWSMYRILFSHGELEILDVPVMPLQLRVIRINWSKPSGSPSSCRGSGAGAGAGDDSSPCALTRYSP